MTLGLTLKTLAVLAIVAASTVAIVLSEHFSAAVSLSQHVSF
ncbi:hypothetical protein [Massilia sp. Root351]|jgi:hypothetical protein|nr:hypothetical protein [Massilia sp. Root351]